MSIEEINKRLERFSPGKVVTFNPNDPLSLKLLLDETIKDARYLLAENQRLVEALEHICEIETDSYEMDKELMFNIARDAIQAYKLLEKKD